MDDIRKTQQAYARKAQARPDHRFDDLYHLLYRWDWLEVATQAVLQNTGAKRPGVDGMNKDDLKTPNALDKFIKDLQTDLRAGTYRPQPVRRVWIPKANGDKRPLGIATLRDRVVQMELKMMMEPIWESDFLNISNGFRPQRRTMDCITWFYRKIQPRLKHFWVIEGDIKGCYDNINHSILMKQIRRRIADRRVIAVIGQFLRAGVVEQNQYSDTLTGTPQGGIASPLWANIYLHQFDLWWQEHYGNLDRYERERRRRTGYSGGVFMSRYADDFVLLTSGTKAFVYELRSEVAEFLTKELQLELSMEKSQVTHAEDGFDFLGFHIQWMTPKNNKPWLRIVPSEKSIQRYRTKIREITGGKWAFTRFPADVIQAVNRVARGWALYYRYVNSKSILNTLDWWTEDRVVRWLQKHHQKGIYWVLRKYQSRQQTGTHNRKNLMVTDKQGNLCWLYKMNDIQVTRYYPDQTKPQNPYLLGYQTETEVGIDDSPEPNIAPHWKGQNKYGEPATYEAIPQARARANYVCERCGSKQNLHAHRKQAGKDGGQYELDNIEILCWECHKQTPTYAQRK